MKKIDDLNDQNPITDGIDDGIGGLFNSRVFYMAPGEEMAATSTKLASKATLTQMASVTTSSQTVLPKGESLQNMIGLSDLVYSSTDSNHALPSKNSIITVNNVSYKVIEVENGPSGYEGMVLLDRSSNAIIVVNRGTQSKSSFGTDAGMAFTTVNNQWKDAQALAQLAANDVTKFGASAVYTDGHSLGGTLAQMQAAYFGWQGYTFNAYGAGEVYKQLGLAISPGASIKNYRTMFDLVSDASTDCRSLIFTCFSVLSATA